MKKKTYAELYREVVELRGALEEERAAHRADNEALQKTIKSLIKQTQLLEEDLSRMEVENRGLKSTLDDLKRRQ